MESARKRRGNITLSAPVGSIDLAAEDENGDPYQIHACTGCLPWHAEVIRDDDGTVFIREWHAVDCQEFQHLLAIVKD